MKKIAKFMVRFILFVIAMVVASPALLIFVEGTTIWPNCLGLAYVLGIIALYKTSDENGWPRRIAEIYRVAFREFFPDL